MTNPALIALAERVERGEVVLGSLPTKLRDGTNEIVVQWRAKRLPRRVCEGGGWYSAHSTEADWDVVAWLRHKGEPGFSFGEIAPFATEGMTLEEAVEQAVGFYRRKYPALVARASQGDAK